jgi:hypothetical protein
MGGKNVLFHVFQACKPTANTVIYGKMEDSEII